MAQPEIEIVPAVPEVQVGAPLPVHNLEPANTDELNEHLANGGKLHDFLTGGRGNRALLDTFNLGSTPLHRAAALGHTSTCLQFLKIMPSYGKKLDEFLLSPLHIAVRDDHYETIRQMAKADNSLIRVTGPNNMTVLHYLLSRPSSITHSKLLVFFLCLSPGSIMDRTSQRKTVLHLTLENGNFADFRILLSWLDRHLEYRQKLLNAKDEEGDRPLHVAARKKNLEIVQLLVQRSVHLQKRNIAGWTPLALAQLGPPSDAQIQIVRVLEHPRGRCCGEIVKSVFGIRGDGVEGMTNYLESLRTNKVEKLVQLHLKLGRLTIEHRNLFMAGLALMVGSAYQGALSPPDQIYDSIGTRSKYGHSFAATNTIIFQYSFLFVISMLNLAALMGLVPLLAMAVSYMLAILPLFPPDVRTFSSYFFVFLLCGVLLGKISYWIFKYILLPRPAFKIYLKLNRRN